MNNLGIIVSELKSGEESFTDGKAALNFSLQEFWSWSFSDLVSNANRGILAEFIVAKALNVKVSYVRNEWDAYDLDFEGLKIEVKSSAYIQTWKQKKLSDIKFSIAPTSALDLETNK